MKSSNTGPHYTMVTQINGSDQFLLSPEVLNVFKTLVVKRPESSYKSQGLLEVCELFTSESKGAYPL